MLQTLRGEGTSRDQIVWVMVEQMGKQAAGEKQGRKPWTLRELGGKTLWDWLQLLIVPVALSLITVAFAWQQDARQQRIEDQRAEAERELAVQRAQDEALQTYIDQMGAFSLRGISVSQKRIAYTGTYGDSEIYTINATGGTPLQVTNNTTDEDSPSYSPDGQRIAFSRWDGTDYEIYTVNATGGGEFQVTNNDMQDYSPDYSPNGERIAYTHCLIPYYEEEEERCGVISTGVDYTEIFTIKATGGTPFRVTNNKTYDDNPSYSPNGQKIAYTGTDVSDLGNDSEIYKINATGGTPVNVTHNKKDDINPSYSPNGRKIAYYRWDENPDGSLNAEIYKIHHNGGTPVRVTNSESLDAAPSWGSHP